MVVQNNFSSKVNLHLTRWTAAQCAVTTSDSLRFLRLQVWWMQHTIKIFSYEICIFTFLYVEVSSTFCVWIGSHEKEMSPHERGQKVQLWKEELLVLTFFLIFMSCRTAMQHFEATMLFCVCVIAVFHHTDDPSLLHMSIFFQPLTVFRRWHKFTAERATSFGISQWHFRLSSQKLERRCRYFIDSAAKLIAVWGEHESQVEMVKLIRLTEDV